MAKSKLPVYFTPKGVAKYPHLSDPDTKFKADGEYHTKVLFDAADPNTQELITLIDRLYEENEARQKSELPPAKAKKAKLADKPYKAEEDPETGEETGNIEVNFKLPATMRPKKGKHAGKVVETRPGLVDAKKRNIDPEAVKIGGGSVIKVSFYPWGWNTQIAGIGITLRLKAVQVIDLVEAGQGGDFGFDEEDGFETDDAPVQVNRPSGPSAFDAEDDDEEDDGALF